MVHVEVMVAPGGGWGARLSALRPCPVPAGRAPTVTARRGVVTRISQGPAGASLFPLAVFPNDTRARPPRARGDFWAEVHCTSFLFPGKFSVFWGKQPPQFVEMQNPVTKRGQESGYA